MTKWWLSPEYESHHYTLAKSCVTGRWTIYEDFEVGVIGRYGFKLIPNNWFIVCK